MGHHGMHIMDNISRNFGFFGILWLIIWITIIVGVVFLIIYLVRRNNGPMRQLSKPAIRILEERFARGEIDEVEYREKRKVLEEE